MEQLNELGAARDPWEVEMLAVARRELARAADLEARADLADVGVAALIGLADNSRGYAEALVYAVRRRREVR